MSVYLPLGGTKPPSTKRETRRVIIYYFTDYDLWLLPWLAVCHRRSVPHSGAHMTASVSAQVVPVG